MNLKVIVFIYKDIELYYLDMIVKIIFFLLLDRIVMLKLQYDISIEWSSFFFLECLSNVANQMKGYMNMVFSNISNFVDCFQMYRRIDVAVSGDQILLNISFVLFEWNRIRVENCFL